ncbi:MAG: FAD-binding oxidoreductase [Armatimonadetes bacterium]|nr:FAD-binding oxidoreductase [Armatimonadota bacterium]
MCVNETFEEIMPIDGIELFEPDERYAVDNVLPKAVARPNSVPSLRRLIELAYEKHWGLIPFGAGTAIHIGNLPSAFDIAIDMRQLQTLLEFEPADLVVTVEAGMRLYALRRMLESHRLFLPVDPPDEDEATVGGVVATNAFGSLLYGYGTVSDWLIGIQVIQPNGKLTNFGGKVVKNVAGYNMVKLYAGSYGTLGVITSATFRLLPMPEHHSVIALTLQSDEHAETVLKEIAQSKLCPTTVMMVEATKCDELIMSRIQQLMIELDAFCEAPILFIGFDDFAEAVSYQVELLKRVASPHVLSVSVFEGEHAERLRSTLRSFQSGQNAKLHIRVNVNPSRAHRLRQEIIATANHCNIEHLLMTSHILDGVIFVSAFDCDDSCAYSFSMGILCAVESHRGNMIIERVPTHIKPSLPIWGRNIKSHSIMRRIKESLDERMLLSQGRFVSGM